jgi:hypothetical protein
MQKKKLFCVTQLQLLPVCPPARPPARLLAGQPAGLPARLPARPPACRPVHTYKTDIIINTKPQFSLAKSLWVFREVS